MNSSRDLLRDWMRRAEEAGACLEPNEICMSDIGSERKLTALESSHSVKACEDA